MGFLFHLVLFGVGCFCLFILTIDFMFCGGFLFLDREKKQNCGVTEGGKELGGAGAGKRLDQII